MRRTSVPFASNWQHAVAHRHPHRAADRGDRPDRIGVVRELVSTAGSPGPAMRLRNASGRRAAGGAPVLGERPARALAFGDRQDARLEVHDVDDVRAVDAHDVRRRDAVGAGVVARDRERGRADEQRRAQELRRAASSVDALSA